MVWFGFGCWLVGFICLLLDSDFLEGRDCALLVFVISPGGSDGKVSVYNEGDLGLIPGSGRSLGEGTGSILA